jgi:hypothetical protein
MHQLSKDTGVLGTRTPHPLSRLNGLGRAKPWNGGFSIVTSLSLGKSRDIFTTVCLCPHICDWGQFPSVCPGLWTVYAFIEHLRLSTKNPAYLLHRNRIFKNRKLYPKTCETATSPSEQPCSWLMCNVRPPAAHSEGTLPSLSLDNHGPLKSRFPRCGKPQ